MILEFYFKLSYKAILFYKAIFFLKKKSMLFLHAIIRDVYTFKCSFPQPDVTIYTIPTCPFDDKQSVFQV